MDRKNLGPQTDYNGRLYVAEVEFYVTKDATEREIEDMLNSEWGWASLPCDHPVNEGDLGSVEIRNVRARNVWSYTDWDAATEDGKRSGRGRRESQPREQVVPSDA
jgi:hypothetical protein